MRKRAFKLLYIIFLFSSSIFLQAQVPQLINYQGNISENNVPLNNTASITFTLFDAETEGTNLWSETQSVTITNGIFNVLLGSVTTFPSDLFSSSGSRFLEVSVNGTSLTPRSQFTSVAYALIAEEVVPNSITGTMIQDGEVGNDDIAEDIISADKINDESGIAFKDSVASIILNPDSYTDLVTVTISVPKSGYIFVSGRGTTRLFGTTSFNGIYMQIADEIGNAESTFSLGSFSFIYMSSFPTVGTYYYDCSVQRVYTVEEGTYTYRLQAQKYLNNGSADVRAPVLTAQYFPTAYGNVSVSSSNSSIITTAPDVIPIQ
ncbi:MAG: hypothetical protein V3V16_02145 [Melioribacteraceae bacterium]